MNSNYSMHINPAGRIRRVPSNCLILPEFITLLTNESKTRGRDATWYNNRITMTETIILNERYQLEERRGAGGMAMVYRARGFNA